MISIYRLFGGVALLLMGMGYFIPLPYPIPIIVGVCLIVAGVALIVGL